MAETLSFDGYLAAVLNYAQDAILSINNQGEIMS